MERTPFDAPKIVPPPPEIVSPSPEVISSIERPENPEDSFGSDFELSISSEAGDLGEASLENARERASKVRESVEDEDLKSRVDEAFRVHADTVSEAVGTVVEGALASVEAEDRPEVLRAKRYRERITSPEALKVLDENSAKWNAMADKFEDLMKDLGNATPEQSDEIHDQLERSAGQLLFGRESSRRVDRFLSAEDLEVEVSDRVARWSAFSDVASQLKNGYTTMEKLRLEARARIIPGQDASAFAIGIKQEDVDRFLQIQGRFYDGGGKVPKTAYEVSHPKRPLSQYDFDMSRHRAYYEARRTARNVFTHVTSSERAMRIIADGKLKASKLTTDSGISDEARAAQGLTGNAGKEENIYFTSGGGGYKYGQAYNSGKSFAPDRTSDDFVFFASTGAAFMAQGKSIEVGRPEMSEQHESGRGRVAGDYESVKGAEIPLDKMFIIAPKAQARRYRDALIAQGRSAKDAYTRVLEIPDDIVTDAMKGGSVRSNDPNIQKWVDENLAKKLSIRTRAYKGLYATTHSRASRDPVSRSTGKVHQWMRMDAPAS